MNFDQLEKSLRVLPAVVSPSAELLPFANLHGMMAELSQERRSLSREEDQLEMSRFRSQLFPVVHESVFCKYVYDKPRGYAGDYITQEMIWLGRTCGGKHLFNGTTRTGELVNAFTFDMANCRANEERVHRLQTYITQSGPRIMSIGCGSCIELWGWRNGNDCPRQVMLVDQDDGALQRAQEMIGRQDHLEVTFEQANVLKYILGKNHLQCGPRDLIYLFGLMDYFPLKSAKRLVQALWPCVAPGGLMVITNAHPDNSTRMWMEYVGDWFLDYKTEEMMYDLADGLTGVASTKLLKDEQGVYQYLNIRKE